MGDNSDEQRVTKSRAYRRARGRAERYLEDPEALDTLVHRARRKAAGINKGPFSDLWDSLTTCLRLIRAYARGEYRDISWQSLGLIVAAIVYFVMPLDLVPDFLGGFGFVDDAVLLGWTLNVVADVIDDFRAWERHNVSDTESTGTGDD